MKKILLTGGNGFLGNHVYNVLKSEYDVARFGSDEIDLTIESETLEYFKNVDPDIVVNMAARLGGIGDNIRNPLAYYETNLAIGLNVLKASKETSVEHLINIGTVCSYPQSPSLPFRENELWNGLPEVSNRYYGLSKRSILDYAMVLSETKSLYTTNLLMANLYGIGDDFRDKTSHVIPAIIKKAHALRDNQTLEVWGDGTPSRDFLNVKDASRIIERVVKIGHLESFPINVGTGVESTINELVDIVLKRYGKSHHQIKHILTKPNGQPRRVLDITRLIELYSIAPLITFEEGIQEVVDWYNMDYENLCKMADKYK